MDPILGGAAIAVGGNILGGILGNSAQNKATEANVQLNRENQELQKQFAQNGVRWKVADARAAGINPLTALGASTHSYSPSSIGMEANTALPDALARSGQDIGRAISATRTADEKALASLSIRSATLDVEGKAIDNQIRASQLQKLNGTGPQFPSSDGNFISGQGSSGPAVIEKPLERTRSLKGHPDSEAGAIPQMGWGKSANGVYPIPSKDVKERIEDNIFHEGMHFWRNNIAPNWGGGTKPPPSALPKGATEWEWSHREQQYIPYFPKYRFERNPKMR